MRAATGLSRTTDERCLRHLTAAQEEEAHQHPRVQELLRKKLAIKDRAKAQGSTIMSYEGTTVHDEYRKAKRHELQRQRHKKAIKKKFEKEQPVIDIQKSNP